MTNILCSHCANCGSIKYDGFMCDITGYAECRYTEEGCQHYKSENRWISVKEKLPDPDTPVLIVVCKKSSRYPWTWKHIEIGEMSDTGSWMLSGEWWYEKDSEDIVCWHPLPDLPELPERGYGND